MKATLTSKFMQKERRNEDSIWASLPLEESLMSPLEQIHFIIGCGIVKPSLRYNVHHNKIKILGLTDILTLKYYSI